jgi:hypothetical protein
MEVVMMYLEELVKKNRHSLIRYNEGIEGRVYMKVFDYSTKYGGTLDGHRYYNDYYIDVTED